MKLAYNNKSGQYTKVTSVDCYVVDVFFKIQTGKNAQYFYCCLDFKNTKSFSDVLRLLNKLEKDPLRIILFHLGSYCS